MAALAALLANLLDVLLGFGSTEMVTYGTKSAIEWFALYNENWFRGVYALGILNIVYMIAMLPVYFALFGAHFDQQALDDLGEPIKRVGELAGIRHIGVPEPGIVRRNHVEFPG